MRIVGFVICIMACAFQGLSAQKIEVKDFGETSEIQMASMQRQDVNGNICALVRVVVPFNERALFQGNVIGDTEYKGNEYLVYMTKGSRFLRIHYPNCETLMVNFENECDECPNGLKAKFVYKLVLNLPNGFLNVEDAEAQNEVGLQYLRSKNYDRAIYWFELAAKAGLVEAQNNLGVCYRDNKEYDKAFYWFDMAANAGYIYAQYNMGLHYRNNNEIKKAIQWFEKAALQNHVDAQCELANYYWGKQEYEKAIPWLERAAKQKHPVAQYKFGMYYFNNEDYTNAVLWFMQSAERGYKQAMEMLSICYRNGWGVAKDLSLAEKWADRANR